MSVRHVLTSLFRRRADVSGTGLLILGHSHVQCLQRALDPEMSADIEICDLNQPGSPLPPEARTLRKSRLTNPAPHSVALCLGGNYHNQIGLFEHPEAYGCGLQDGTLPDMTDRQLIPYALLRDQFAAHFNRLHHLHRAIAEAFPNAQFVHFNPPPPIGDWAHIVAHPGIFGKFLKQGPMPPEMRLELYDIQTDVLRDTAKAFGATFVMPPEQVRDADGFLRRAYFNTDPTHGNTAYGQLMLSHLVNHTKGTP